MLERVALGQTRFQAPGVSADARGIVLGKYGVVILAGLDSVVGWLRVYSAESSLDDLLAELSILRLRSSLGSRAFAIRFAASSSYVCDRAARCARLVGGQVYTGTSRQFVKYRDEHSPYGYDLVDPAPIAASVELCFHGPEVALAYATEAEI